jgi:cytoplasmic iron level regulating protein YaaA (DUF328/UPF0246 family)
VVKSLQRAVRDVDDATAKKLFGATGFLLERALACARAAGKSDTPTLPAWQRYTGVVWTHLEPETLAQVQRACLVIPSGLYGISLGTDPIVDFRLTMAASLPAVGTLHKFWRRHLTEVLIETVDDGMVFDLLPAEHRSAFDTRALQHLENYIAVDFVRRDGHGTAGHAAKAVKGVMARTLLDAGIDGAKRFSFEGWKTVIRQNRIIVIAP